MGSTSAQDGVLEVPVLIAGGGPTGLLAACLLSKLCVQSLVIEKYPRRLAAPKAHALCPRTLEICRQFGLDTAALRRLGTRREDAYWVNFLTSLSGEQIGVLPYERMDPGVLDDTPEMIHNIPQPDFEEFLAERLRDDPNVEIRKGVAFVSCEQTNDHVLTTVEERDTKATYKIRSRHVIGCDGAKSQVRKWLGIESDGEDSYETMMTIHFSADLRPVVGERVGMLHWSADPACSGFVIAYDLSGSQVLITSVDAARCPPPGSWTEETARGAVRAALGPGPGAGPGPGPAADVPLRVLGWRPWAPSRRVARRYHRGGRVLLAGDAAHSFPPTGGLGLNAGLADVHNLAWRIALADADADADADAAAALGASYEAERRPVAEVCALQSVRNGRRVFSFLRALGTAGVGDVGEARARLLRTIRDPDRKQAIADEVEGQREHFDNLEIHIGYVYGRKEPPAHASRFTPKFVAGARLPHAWIRLRGPAALPPVDVSYVKEFSKQEVEARQYSTLDLCPFDSFTLLVGSRSEWAERFRALEDSLGSLGVKVCLHVAGEDFHFVDEKYARLFAAKASLELGGGLLVRPDQHLLRMIKPNDTWEDLSTEVMKQLGH